VHAMRERQGHPVRSHAFRLATAFPVHDVEVGDGILGR
jgi:hypothetical protein